MTPENDKTEPVPSFSEIASALGFVLPLSGLAAFASGVSGPVSAYVGLNFFAQRHTDLAPDEIHCDLYMQSLYCKEAVLDSTRMMMVMTIIGPIVQFLLLPMVGVLSDATGRRNLILFYSAVFLLYMGTGVSFLFFNTSMYWSFAFMPFVVNPITAVTPGAVVYSAMAIDLIDRPSARSTAFGMIEAVGKLAMLLGNAVGSFLTMKVACCTSFAIGVFTFLLMVWLLPETLPPERRLRGVTWRMLLPGLELRILWRSRALQLLSITIMWVTFVSAGWGRTMPLYMQYGMNFTSRESYIGSILSTTSGMLALGLLFRPLVQRVGEVGVVAFDLVWGPMGVFVTIFLMKQPWQVLLSGFIFTGPAVLSLPAVAALKSMLVGPDEQGLMQAALNTIVSIAASAGVFTIGSVFDATNRGLLDPSQTDIEVNKLAFAIIIPLYLLPLWFVSRLGKVIWSEGLGDEPGSAASSGPAGEQLALAQERRYRPDWAYEGDHNYGSAA